MATMLLLSQIVKEMNSPKTLMWPSWSELLAEIPEFEADLRHELLYMIMIVKGRWVTGFICCVFCVCLNVLNRHAQGKRETSCLHMPSL